MRERIVLNFAVYQPSTKGSQDIYVDRDPFICTERWAKVSLQSYTASLLVQKDKGMREGGREGEKKGGREGGEGGREGGR